MKLSKVTLFCATGITPSDLVSGIEIEKDKFISETLLTHKHSKLKGCKIKSKIITISLINRLFYNKKRQFGPFVYRLGHGFILERGVRSPRDRQL